MTVAGTQRAIRWALRGRELDLSQPVVAGIVNVNDDSFFSGARSGSPEQAVEDGTSLVNSGFDMLDVGAVPAGSGAAVAADEEAARLLPAVEGLVERTSFPISVDTFSPEVARRAVAAGAEVVNDIGGGAPGMLDTVAEAGCGYVLMHIEGPPRQDRKPRAYDDPVQHLKAWFSARIEAALERGIAEERIAVDPGLDFDLSVADNVAIMRRLGELHALGRPLFVSLSRKDFLGALLAGSWEERLPPERREWATAAAASLAVAQGAQVLRLHDRSALDAVRVAGRIAHG